ncbi:MAG: hypothetical protein M0Z84_09385 [Gammaproteobacteria bacterium]|nr:hypothetical protein [Gammaproteobacteria bacterium]
MKSASRRAWGFAVLIASAGHVAQARETWNLGPHEVYVQAGLEQYNWKEFNSSGSTLDRESGPLFVVGAGVDNFRRGTSGPIYQADGRLYWGTLVYDGQTQGGVPLTTHSGYTGLRGEGLGGYRFARWRHGVDLFGGAGWEYWSRSLQNALAVNGSPAFGYQEQYSILYSKLGVGFYREFGSWSYRIKVGGKYPLYTYEYANLGDGLRLSPGREWSGFARVTVEFGPDTRSHFGLVVSYDSLRFSRSSPALLTVVGAPSGYYVQPESHRDVYSIRGVYYFR